MKKFKYLLGIMALSLAFLVACTGTKTDVLKQNR